MNNNRKQKITATLDSLTSKELEEYVSSKGYINSKVKEILNKIQANREEKHTDILFKNINEDINSIFSRIYKLGQAWVIAFVLECFYNDKYKISDLQSYLKIMIKDDLKLKELVYEIMKDF